MSRLLQMSSKDVARYLKKCTSEIRRATDDTQRAKLLRNIDVIAHHIYMHADLELGDIQSKELTLLPIAPPYKPRWNKLGRYKHLVDRHD